MNRVVHFEIPSDDPAKSTAFYRDVFGWSFHQFGEFPYWLAVTGPADQPGIDGGLMKKNHPQQPVTFAIEVANIDASLEAVAAHGAVVAVPKMAIPGVGWTAYFKDLDGNIIGVHQRDPLAK